MNSNLIAVVDDDECICRTTKLLMASSCFSDLANFITAYGNKDTRRRAMQAGAVAFLDKPFSNAQLLETIRPALQLDTETRQTSDSSV